MIVTCHALVKVILFFLQQYNAELVYRNERRALNCMAELSVYCLIVYSCFFAFFSLIVPLKQAKVMATFLQNNETVKEAGESV